MSAERVIANTRRIAQADLDAAELLHAGKNRYAVYHCEQAAEKIIKIVPASEGNPRQHPIYDVREFLSITDWQLLLAMSSR